MKKIICKKVYDTENSVLLKKNSYKNFGDVDGHEESLYQTADGLYFLYVNGGSQSKYPTEDIKRIAKKDIEKYL